MLLKLRNLLFGLIIIAGVGYAVYFVFIIPAGFTDKEELINSYFTNIQSESLCEDHFNPETEDFCLNLQILIENRTLVVTTLTKDGDNYLATVSVDGVDNIFEISFIEVEVTGLKSFMNSTYYLIDLII